MAAATGLHAPQLGAPCLKYLGGLDQDITRELKEFAAGASLSSLPALESDLALLHNIPLNETSIEAKHSLAVTNLRSSSHPMEASVSVAMRLPEWRDRFQRHPEVLPVVVDNFSPLLNGAGGRLMALVQEVDLLPHPEVHVGVNNSTLVLEHRLVRQVLYHSDLGTLYQDLKNVEDLLKKTKGQD